MDLDGATDCVWASVAGYIGWFKNAGGGAFIPTPLLASATAVAPYALQVADLNGDGLYDIIAGRSCAGRRVVGNSWNTMQLVRTECASLSVLRMHASPLY